MKTKALLFALAAAIPGASYAEAIPAPMQYDNRVRTVDYNPNDIVHIQGAYGIVTKISFGDDETVQHVSLGDSLAWEVAPVKNHLFVKPREPNAYTNMSVITDKHTYDLELNVTDKKSPNVFLRVVFAYPVQEAKLAAAQAKKEQEIRQIALMQLNQKQQERHKKARLDTAMRSAETPERAHINYWVRGSEEVAPDEAWDDGTFTYFRFRGNREIPVIYLQDDEDEESLINTTVKGDTVIVQRLAHRYILRKHKSVAQVVNPNYDPVGKASMTGTITPKVKRAIKNGEDPHPAVLPSLPAEARDPAPMLPERVDIEDVQEPEDLPVPTPPAYLSLLRRKAVDGPIRLQGEAPKAAVMEPTVAAAEPVAPTPVALPKKKDEVAEAPVVVAAVKVDAVKVSVPKLSMPEVEQVAPPMPAPVAEDEPELFFDEMATNKSPAEILAEAAQGEPVATATEEPAPKAEPEPEPAPQPVQVAVKPAPPAPEPAPVATAPPLTEPEPVIEAAKPVEVAVSEPIQAEPVVKPAAPTLEASPLRERANTHLYNAIDEAMSPEPVKPAPTPVAKTRPSMVPDLPKAALESPAKAAPPTVSKATSKDADAAAALIAEAEAGLIAFTPTPAPQAQPATPQAPAVATKPPPVVEAKPREPKAEVYVPRVIPDDAPRPPKPPDAKVYTGPIDQETWINLYIDESAPTYSGPSFRTGKIARVIEGTWRRAIGRDATGEWFAIVDKPYTSWVHASAALLDGEFDRLPLHPLGGSVSSTLATN